MISRSTFADGKKNARAVHAVTTFLAVGVIVSGVSAGGRSMLESIDQEQTRVTGDTGLPGLNSGEITGRHVEIHGDTISYYLDLRSCDASGACTDGERGVSEETYRSYVLGADYPAE